MDSELPKGRARGRARGIQLPQPQQAGDQRVQRPGTAPAPVQAALLGRGRGVSQETAPGPMSGRAKPRAAASAAATGGQVREITQKVGAVALSSSDSDVSGSHNSGNSGSGSGNGNGSNGNGEEMGQSAGRGAKRGRPTETRILRTKPSHVNDKKGTEGAPVSLQANYFKLKKKPNWKLFQYRVDMKPEIDYTKERKYYVKSHTDLKNYFFDGTILISNHPITKSKDEPYIFTTKRSSDDQVIEVTIRLVGEVDPTSSTYCQFLSIILRSMLEKLNLELIGRNYYDTKAKIRDKKLADRKLEMFPGYVTSIHQHEADILLNVEISHKVIRIDSVLDVINEVTKKARGNVQAALDKALLGQIVITKYNMKTYKICEIRLDQFPTLEFEDKKGNKRSLLQYYKDRWGMNISNAKQPLIVSVPKERDPRGLKMPAVQLVPELCNMTGLSEEQRNDFRLMQDVAVYTRQGPEQKYKGLEDFSRRINETPEIKDVLQKWDIEFSKELVGVTGRQFDPQTIEGGQGCSATYGVQNADWGNAFRNWKCRTSASLKKWIIITPARDQANAEELKKSLEKVFRGLGMDVAPPKVVVIQDAKIAFYRAALDEWTPRKPELIMIVLPNVNEDLYSMVKKYCCINAPVASQVVTGRVLSKPKGLMSVATKIALQMNCKLGGELWAVKIPLAGAMMVGYDTYHDTQQKGKSVGALVASLNKDCNKYFSTAEHHETNCAQEVSDKIGTMLSSALYAYTKENNGAFPTRIFFFRDGVGDGQIPHVFNSEVKTMKDAIKNINPAIQLTVIITSKRINARFMTTRGHLNPNSGTVIDDVVTNPERYDYFIVSQSVRQGTVNPTSYNVIYDEIKLPPGKMQLLTYKLTHLYFNWPGTVRVPAPVQYAHKLAYLTGMSLHSKAHSSLEDKLFYL